MSFSPAMIKTLIVFLFAGLAAAGGLPAAALASGLQISPSSLDFTVTPGTEQTLTLNIANPTSDVQIFEVYPDDYQKNLVVIPSSFTLESGAKKSVKKALGSKPSKTIKKKGARLAPKRGETRKFSKAKNR